MTIKEMMVIVENNSECVLLGFKPNITRMDKILSGIFTGDEDFIRVTYGRDHEMTVYKIDGKHWGISWGYHGFTLISESTRKMKNTILDFLEANGIGGLRV